MPGLEAHFTQLTADRNKVLAERDAIPLATVAMQIKELERQIDETRRNLAAHRTCPHCDGALSITNGAITVPEDMDVLEQRIDRWTADRNEAMDYNKELQALVEPLTNKLRELDAFMSDTKSTLDACRRVTQTTGTVQTEADRAALAQAEQAVEDTREVVKLVQAEADATRIHQTIIRYTEIARALGPEGRAKQDAGRRDAQVERRVGGYRQRVGLACLPRLATERAPCSLGDRPVALCSESERWRLRTRQSR